MGVLYTMFHIISIFFVVFYPFQKAASASGEFQSLAKEMGIPIPKAEESNRLTDTAHIHAQARRILGEIDPSEYDSIFIVGRAIQIYFVLLVGWYSCRRCNKRDPEQQDLSLEPHD